MHQKYEVRFNPMNTIIFLSETTLNFNAIDECQMRTNPKDGMDYVWVNSLAEQVQDLPDNAPHKKEMTTRLSELQSSINKTYKKCNDFFNAHPYMIARYADIEFGDVAEFFEDSGLIKMRANYDFGPTRCSLNVIVDKRIEDLNFEDLTVSQRVKKLQELFATEQFEYTLEAKITRNNLPLKNIKVSHIKEANTEDADFLNEIEVINQTDLEITSQFLFNTKAILNYQDQRKIITDILTRTKKDNLFKPATQESVIVFQQLMSQEKILGISPKQTKDELISKIKKMM